MKRAFVIALALASVAPRPVWAKGDKKTDKDDDDDKADDASDDDADAAPKKKPKAKAKTDDDDSGSDKPAPVDKPDTNTLAEKQDLTGHDLGAAKKATTFERDRFFVDKSDTEDTEHTTLIQGSLTSSSFLYFEKGGDYAIGTPGMGPGSDAATFARYFTDLRLQTDFRHISGSRWDARVDARIRVVDQPTQTFDTTATGTGTPTNPNIQSGLTGQNEYEIRELWLVRNGDRTDVIFGRQFIPDLAGVKIDGLRIDYASSKTFTLLGFAGLYPVRGSRSITTDYVALKNDDGTNAGTFVGAGGFGAAYRTAAAYGSFGGVVLDPLDSSEKRLFATSTGYWRYGSKLDFYHFALVDVASDAGITNLSAGLNYKPDPRLRLTLSYNHVDTETLNVQANAFLSAPDSLKSVINNEVYVSRLATDEVRGSISAGLGALQRFEITVAAAYRERPGFTLASLDATGTTPATIVAALPAEEGFEVYGSITDRHSIKDARLGIDAVRSYAVGDVAYQRTDVTALRAFMAHEIKEGRGEFEAEVSYATTQDSLAATNVCTLQTNPTTCFGDTSGKIISIGGTLYYRINRDWFTIGTLYLSQTTLTAAGATSADPAITGVTGFYRIAYRF